MANVLLLLICFILFSLFSFSTPLPSTTILNAAEILSNSGFDSMALTLELVSQTLIPQSSSATIFSPSDGAFASSGQPPLSLLQFHFSPLALSLHRLQSLPLGTKIPTLFPGHSLIVTSSGSGQQVSLNNVLINGSPVYDDGSLVIFAIDKFFDPHFQILAPIQSPSSEVGCIVWMNSENSFVEASVMMRSRGYSVMASFLVMQLLGFVNKQKLTVFAPNDEVMAKYIGNYTDYSSIFLRHIVNCKLSYVDLVTFDEGTVLGTSLEGFTVKITRSAGTVILNQAAVVFPEMYYSDWLVVHGINEILTSPNRQEDFISVPETGGNREGIVSDPGEF